MEQVQEIKSAKEGSAFPRRRTLRGLLIRPREQLKYSLVLVSGGLMIMFLFIGFLMYVLHDWLTVVEKSYGSDAQAVEMAQALQNHLQSSLGVLLIQAFLIAIYAVIIGIRYTHRFYGPVVAFRRQIDALKNGDYTSRVYLRKGDEMGEIESALNDLAQSLEARHGTASVKSTLGN